jgi:pimeloyl-[acyl-carrier protein] methyl ester esterase
MTPLVFWHGWGMRSAAWHSLAHHLNNRCELHLPSLPGYDDTPAPRPYTAEAVVDLMLTGQTKPITLCGWSLGAMLAMLAAQRHPDKVQRLILISATPSFVQRDGWKHGISQKAFTEFADAVSADATSAIRRFITLFNHNDSQAHSNARELGEFNLPQQAVLDGGLALLRDMDLRPLIPDIRQPTPLIHGARDPLMPLAAAEWLASTLPAAKLEVCPHAAHAPFISDPVHCSHLISEWLML